MDLKNENSKIYFLIKIFSVCMIISAILYFIADRGTAMKQKYLHIVLVFGILDYMLIGTKKVIAQNNKKGYSDYLIAAIYCLVLYTSLQNL